jgi:hypothetical protein
MRDEIDLAKAGAGVVPLATGANGDRLLEPRAGLRGGGPASRGAGARRCEQTGERGAAGLSYELVDVRGHGELAPPEEPVEQLGHKGVQPVGADAATGLPEDLDGGGDREPIPPQPPGAGRRRRRPRGSTQQPDGGFAVQACDRDDLVQESRCFSRRGAC